MATGKKLPYDEASEEVKHEPVTTVAEDKIQDINVDKIVDRWNNMANFYKNGLNEFLSPTTQSLLPHLGLNDDTKPNFKLLDAAVGDGFNSIHIIKQLICYKSCFEYYGFDLSPKMIEITQQSIKDDKLLSLALNNNENQNKYKINISVQNSEHLSTHKENTFDAYISSLCLMLTANPLNMIKEAYRVLKSDGISAFSIWGFSSKSNYFQSFAPIYRDINIELGIDNKNNANIRSNYHLADSLQETIAMFKSIGFKTVYYWDINVAITWNTAKSWSAYYLSSSPRFSDFLDKCKNEQQRNKIKKIMIDGLNQRFDDFVMKQNKAITHNNICIIAIK